MVEHSPQILASEEKATCIGRLNSATLSELAFLEDWALNIKNHSINEGKRPWLPKRGCLFCVGTRKHVKGG